MATTTRVGPIAKQGGTPTVAPVRGTGFAATTRPPPALAPELVETAAELGHRFAGLSLGAPVQAKLAVSEPGDRHEREADRVAEAVAAHGAAPASPTLAPPPLAVPPAITPLGERDAEARQEPAPLERAATAPARTSAPPAAPAAPAEGRGGGAPAGGSGGGGAPAGGGPPDGAASDGEGGALDEAMSALEEQLARPRASGRALPATTRSLFEARLGVDFGAVRLHTDDEAARLNAQLGAVAFTHGRDVYFSPGAYDPSSQEGLKLLAHELTHVVQQHGGSAAPTVGRVDRSIISGETAGKKMQELLMAANSDLIVEAPIPGATRDKGVGLERVGWADLYWTSDTNHVVWVRGKTNPTGGLDYEPVKAMKKTRAASGKLGHNPTFVAQNKPFKGDFPATFKVADIKQAWAGSGLLEKLGEGLFQVDAYIEGMRQFAEQAQKDGKSSVIPAGTLYEDLKIPPGVDYANFDMEIKSATPSSPNVILGDRRVWMHHAKKRGLYLVFDLVHPFKDPDYRKALEAAWAPLQPVRKKLTAKPPQAGGKISEKRRAGGGGRRRAQRRRLVQRSTDWAAAGKAWEEERKDWDTKYAKPFLKSKEAGVLKEKVAIDDALGLQRRSLDVWAQGFEYKQIGLWSGASGSILGALRFKLGPLFDKVVEFIDWARGKLEGFLSKVRGLRPKGGGWVETIMKVLLEGLKIAFRETVSLLFDMYRDCLNGIMSEVVSDFASELSQQLIDWLNKTHDGFVQWVVSVYQDFEDTYKKYQELIDTVLDISNIISEIASYEKYIRAALQALACLEPPGWGCLWGAVAQFALEDVVDLAVDTDFFHDHVIKPLARKLLSGFLDQPFKKLIFKTMDAVGLGDWARRVKACHADPKEMEKAVNLDRVLDAMPEGMAVNSPEFKKRKEEWNQKMMNKYGGQLLGKFLRGGKPATVNDVQRLVDAIGQHKIDPGKVKDALQKATGSDGKVDIDGAVMQLEPLSGVTGEGGVPPLSVHERLGGKGGVQIGPTEQGPGIKIPF